MAGSGISKGQVPSERDLLSIVWRWECREKSQHPRLERCFCLRARLRPAGLPRAGCDPAASLSERAPPAAPCFAGRTPVSLRGGTEPRQPNIQPRKEPLGPAPLVVAASRSAGSGRQARGGEEGREREIEALRDIHSKFIGAKLQSAWICFLLEITGNYRHQQLLFK